MRENAQLLLVSGLLMSITVIAVSTTITHSVNMGQHQGERHDLTPLISSLESHFPLALQYEVENTNATSEDCFETVSDDFESLFLRRGYSLSFQLVSVTENSGSYDFSYGFEVSDGTLSILFSNQTVSF